MCFVRYTLKYSFTLNLNQIHSRSHIFHFTIVLHKLRSIDYIVITTYK